MRQTEHNAYFTSIVLHASAVAAIVLAAYAAGFSRPKGPQILTLVVAGEGNNYMATDAPALGSPDVTVKLPKLPQPTPPQPQPAQEAQPEPVTQAPITPVPTPTPKPSPPGRRA